MKNTLKFERIAKYFTIFSMGFFGLLAQTLLFRIFLIVFDGNELSIGFFFFSWLIWVCIGALLAKSHFISKLADYFYILILLYLPLFILQQYLFINAQNLIGGHTFELLSLSLLIPFVLLFNAPISFMTGLLFVLGADWMKQSSVSATVNYPNNNEQNIKFDTAVTTPFSKNGVIRVYICESLGSFFGALLVTILLFTGYATETVFLAGALIVLFSTLPHILQKTNTKINKFFRIIIPALIFFILFILLTGYATVWNGYSNYSEWQNFLRQGRYQGSFSTPQSKYLYGTYKNEFIVSAWNSTYEALPNTESASRIAGEYLSQNPKAENVLVIGPGSYSICRTFSKLSQIKKIVWLDTDPNYPEHLLKILPSEFQGHISKSILETPKCDVRKYIHENNHKFDLIILNLPSPSTLILNRYFTFIFFEQLQNVTAPDGVMGINFPAGANYMGTELSYMGSSLLYTLQQVYDYIVLKPGDESRFFATNKKSIVSSTGKVLQSRLNGIKDIKKIYSPEYINSAFEKDRITFQMNRYEEIINKYPHKQFFNTDKDPKSFLYTLLFSIKKLGNTGFSISELNIMFQVVFPWVVLVIFIYFILRFFYYYYYGTKISKHENSFKGLWKVELYFCVFVAAVSGLGINLILIFLFQIYFGSVFLYYGVITALFMLGLFISGLTVEKLLHFFQPKNLLFFISLFYLVYILLIYLYPPEFSKSYFAILFLLAGTFCGPYFALAAFSLKKQNITEIQSASRLEIIDNFGGAVGSLLCSVILLPFIGINKTLVVMFLLLKVILFHSLFLRGKIHKKIPRQVLYTRAIGFIMLGVALLYVIGSTQFWDKEAKLKFSPAKWSLTNQQIQNFSVDKHTLVQKTGEFNGNECTYYIVKDKNQIVGYIFKTKDYTNDIHGYSSPIHMLSYVNQDGKIQNFTILESNETPAFLNKVLESKSIFLGQSVFNNYDKYQLNAITGATKSTTAMSKTLLDAGSKFSAIILNKGGMKKADKSPDLYSYFLLFILALFTLIAIILRYINKRLIRYSFLIAVIAVLGIMFNIQYSMIQVYSVISFKLYLSDFNTFLFLCITIPILIILFGNIYCGYLCPFGAFLEMLNCIAHFVLKKLGIYSSKVKISRRLWTFGRSLKYIILFVLIILFVSSQSVNIAVETDILPYVFSFFYPSVKTLFFILALIIISLIYRRFWCRVLCPAGAFLSLFNAIRTIRKTKVEISRCDLGIYSKKDIDCLCCDNCRQIKTTYINNSGRQKITNKIYNYLFIILCLICFTYMILTMYHDYKNQRALGSIVNNLKTPLVEQATIVTQKPIKPIKFSKTLPSIKSIGTPRNIDIQKYKEYINKGALSGKEALYYKTVD